MMSLPMDEREEVFVYRRFTIPSPISVNVALTISLLNQIRLAASMKNVL